jgi:tRNA A37 threonylcarbamoyladenosine dehydratase
LIKVRLSHNKLLKKSQKSSFKLSNLFLNEIFQYQDEKYPASKFIILQYSQKIDVGPRAGDNIVSPQHRKQVNMMSQINSYINRFGGIKRLYGKDRAELLPHLHICVIGIGGVGSWSVEALARSGVGQLTLIDYDDIALSNINRQIHTLESTLGLSKVEVMRARVREINPDCICHIIDDMLSENNLPKYLSNEYDFVIDAIDSVKQKSALIAYCRRNKIPLITTGGAGGLLDPTAVQIADLSKTHNDPLAAKVRSRLRYQYNFSRNPKSRFGIECVYSTEQQMYPQADGSVGQQKSGVKGINLDCNFGYGSSSCITAVFGFTAAARAIVKSLDKRLRK